MASATRQDDEKAMAEQAITGGADEPRDDDRDRDRDDRDEKQLEYRQPAPAGTGFFHIYKSGQGYWTRMGTAGGAALLGLLSANFLYRELPAQIDWLGKHRGS